MVTSINPEFTLVFDINLPSAIDSRSPNGDIVRGNCGVTFVASQTRSANFVMTLEAYFLKDGRIITIDSLEFPDRNSLIELAIGGDGATTIDTRKFVPGKSGKLGRTASPSNLIEWAKSAAKAAEYQFMAAKISTKMPVPGEEAKKSSSATCP